MTNNKTVHIPLEAVRWPIQREWVPLDDLCDGVYDCPHSTPIITTCGPFVARSQDVRTGVFRMDEAARVSEETYQERIARAEPAHGDILYSREGTYFGIAAEVPENTRLCLGQRMVLIRPKKGKLNSRFLRLWLNSPVLSRHIHGFRDGTVAERLNMPTIRALPIPVFNLKDQETIASIIGAFDDKIELNRQMNETLKGTARAIFKDWFADFGPCRAKREGLTPYLAPEIWALFPDAFDNSELGAIPRGWAKGSLGDLIHQRSERVGTRDVIVLSAVADGKLARSDDHFKKRVYSKETAKYLAVEQWDFAYNPSRINIGSIGMLEEDILGGVSPVYVVARPKSVYRWFLEFSIRRASTKTWINTFASGSVRQSLSYSDFAAIPCVVPPEAVAQEFNRIWNTLRDTIKLHERESETLADLRDLLLPRLISGEVQLRKAEKLVRKVS